MGQRPAGTRTATDADVKSGLAKSVGETIQVPESNPLLELARGIEGNAATAQGRGDMAFGGQGGVPFLKSYSDPLGNSHQTIEWRGFKTPTTLSPDGGTSPVTPPAPPPHGGPVILPPNPPPPKRLPPRTTPGPGIGVGVNPLSVNATTPNGWTWDNHPAVSTGPSGKPVVVGDWNPTGV